ncbi:hypothetical protein N665_0209s0018 [Sinapis alba]|nr:hypothetical protein N665_0209s0018 [Sinapis alba]
MAKKQALVNMRKNLQELEVKMANTSLTNEKDMEENASETCSHMKKLCDSITKARVLMSKAFSTFNFLTIINLSYTNLENEGTIALVNALKNSAPSLKAIEMAGNNITDEVAPDIAACLAAKKHLKRLNLSKNDLKDEGCFVIAQSLEALELKYVDMSYNNLRREGALSLAHVVVKKEGFKMLNIDGNMISFEGIEEVREIFKNCPKLLGPLDDDQELENLEDYEDEFVSVFYF